jgi:N-glycosylase/DNA lyase
MDTTVTFDKPIPVRMRVLIETTSDNMEEIIQECLLHIDRKGLGTLTVDKITYLAAPPLESMEHE